MNGGNCSLITKLPVFDGKNWNRLMIQMRVLFGAQDVLDLVNDGYTTVTIDATEAQRNTYRELRKKNKKALSDESVKKVKLKSLRKQYENFNMKNSGKIPNYISRVVLIINEMKSCGKTLSGQVIIEKVLISLTPYFDYIVVVIGHSKDLSSMRIKELQSSLEAQELCLTERTFEREVEQSLKASSGKKNQKQSWSEAKKRHGGYQKSETSNYDEKKHQKGEEKFDKKKEWEMTRSKRRMKNGSDQRCLVRFWNEEQSDECGLSNSERFLNYYEGQSLEVV
ncbi:uncharacterized protein LOC127093633 [Lathyrus oleraceus]|uniref:uncharacterized protein LOC127093633 n=1 Tax=Pisum sativum TaxID=3888 RepID=UPI0021D21E77|nr:uncharacterized protein LOC127093633 [Pisum sativum]